MTSITNSSTIPGYIAGVPPVGYRPLKDREITPAIQQHAIDIFHQTVGKPFGTTIEFDADGKHYIGRVEWHKDPVGSKSVKINGENWGGMPYLHRGISVYQALDQEPTTNIAGRSALLQRLMKFLESLEQEM
jgi:hypothetical protein